MGRYDSREPQAHEMTFRFVLIWLCIEARLKFQYGVPYLVRRSALALWRPWLAASVRAELIRS